MVDIDKNIVYNEVTLERVGGVINGKSKRFT